MSLPGSWKLSFVTTALLALAAFGCGQSSPAPTTASTSGKLAVGQAAGHDEHREGDGHDHGKDGDKHADHDHSGWWCAEHGVPEAICSQCDPKYAAECQKKGDWCEDHGRAKSQCFLCDSKLKEKFAAQYRAKFGKEPSPTEDESDKKI